MLAKRARYHTEEDHVQMLQAANEMDGSEKELLPQWVKDAVLQSRFPQLPELKCAFSLHPFEVSMQPGRFAQELIRLQNKHQRASSDLIASLQGFKGGG